MSLRYYANNAPQQTLQSGITSGATSCVINGSFAGWPTNWPYTAVLEKGTANEEVVLVTAVSGTTATITRGYDGYAATAHSAGATLDFCVSKIDFAEANAHVNASTNVHGISGSVVGTSDVQTLTNKTLTSPTINGATVSGTVSGGTYTGATLTSPTLNTPTVNTPTVSGGTTANGVHTGDATHPALVGKATTAGGTTLSLQNSSGTAEVTADDAGNLSATGTIQGAGISSTGAVTATTALNGASLAISGTTAQVNGHDILRALAGNAKVATGTQSGTFSSQNAITVTITFGPTFAANPVLIPAVFIGSNLDVDVNIQTISTTGATLRVFQKDGNSISGACTVHWLAIGS